MADASCGFQTGPRCPERPASCQGGARHLGATLSRSASAVHRVHETLSGSGEQRLAGSKSTQSLLRLLQGTAVFLSVQPTRVISDFNSYQLSKCRFYSSTTLFCADPSRSGITRTCCTKLCRRRIRQTSRTWTSMTSPQPVTPGVLRQVQASKPKWPMQATAKTTLCQQSTPPRKEPIKLSHTNG